MQNKQNKVFKAKLNEDFFLVDNRFVISDKYKNTTKIKKITGTKLGSIFDTKNGGAIKTWMQMFNLYSEPFDDIYSNVGQTIEPLLREYYSNLTHTKYISYDPKKINYDLFPDLKIFGGIPDGEPTNDQGEIDYSTNHRIIEIKTVSIDSFVFDKVNGFLKMQKDALGAPIVKKPNEKYLNSFFNNQIQIKTEYLFQLSLYMYLKHIQHGVFVIGFVPTKNYLTPQDYQIAQNDVRIVNFDLDLNRFKWYVDYVQKWYETYVDSGVSPRLSAQDLKWFEEAYDNE